jgi:hypothetical protein
VQGVADLPLDQDPDERVLVDVCEAGTGGVGETRVNTGARGVAAHRLVRLPDLDIDWLWQLGR